MTDDVKFTIWFITTLAIFLLTLVAGYNLGKNIVYEQIIKLEQTENE